MAAKGPRWGSLRSTIDGELVLPDSSAYEAWPRPFNARFHDIRPAAIVACATPQDVSETVSFARRNALNVAVRGGGHSFAGHSSTRGVLIDVGRMRSVSVSGEVATVGGGARLGDVYESLRDRNLAIPGGTCPSVGVAGLTLGGGLGILGRSHGVTSDRLIGAEVVLADGRIVRCDEHHDSDLFWALRGAGAGNFGVVTSLVFRTVRAPDVMNFRLTWPPARAASIVRAWQEWAPVGPDELAASLKVTVAGRTDLPPSVDVYAAFLGPGSDATELIDRLIHGARSDPTAVSGGPMSFSETRRFWSDLDGPNEEAVDADPSAAAPHLYARSEFFGSPLPTEAIAALVKTFLEDPGDAAPRELDFMPWGGAYNRMAPDATAFVHRDELFQLKHAAVAGAEASAKDAARRWVTRSWACVHPWGSGRVFQNFPDPDLPDPAAAYYGLNRDRVVEIKRRYDPDGLFPLH